MAVIYNYPRQLLFCSTEFKLTLKKELGTKKKLSVRTEPELN